MSCKPQPTYKWIQDRLKERDTYREALKAVLVPTNFISLDAARCYIREVLEEPAVKASDNEEATNHES